MLIDNGRYNFGLFFLHLSLEKMLKALVTRETGTVPPKTHDLLMLTNRAKMQLTADLSAVLGEFQAYCMAGRYPDAEPGLVDHQLAERELARAKEVYSWLQQQFNK